MAIYNNNNIFHSIQSEGLFSKDADLLNSIILQAITTDLDIAQSILAATNISANTMLERFYKYSCVDSVIKPVSSNQKPDIDLNVLASELLSEVGEPIIIQEAFVNYYNLEYMYKYSLQVNYDYQEYWDTIFDITDIYGNYYQQFRVYKVILHSTDILKLVNNNEEYVYIYNLTPVKENYSYLHVKYTTPTDSTVRYFVLNTSTKDSSTLTFLESDLTNLYFPIITFKKNSTRYLIPEYENTPYYKSANKLLTTLQFSLTNISRYIYNTPALNTLNAVTFNISVDLFVDSPANHKYLYNFFYTQYLKNPNSKSEYVTYINTFHPQYSNIPFISLIIQDSIRSVTYQYAYIEFRDVVGKVSNVNQYTKVINKFNQVNLVVYAGSSVSVSSPLKIDGIDNNSLILRYQYSDTNYYELLVNNFGIMDDDVSSQRVCNIISQCNDLDSIYIPINIHEYYKLSATERLQLASHAMSICSTGYVKPEERSGWASKIIRIITSPVYVAFDMASSLFNNVIKGIGRLFRKLHLTDSNIFDNLVQLSDDIRLSPDQAFSASLYLVSFYLAGENASYVVSNIFLDVSVSTYKKTSESYLQASYNYLSNLERERLDASRILNYDYKYNTQLVMFDYNNKDYVDIIHSETYNNYIYRTLQYSNFYVQTISIDRFLDPEYYLLRGK